MTSTKTRHYIHQGPIALDGGQFVKREDRQFDLTLCGLLIEPKVPTAGSHSQPTEGKLCERCHWTL